MSQDHKDDMTDLIIENETYTKKQMADIIKYCEADVLNLEQLFYKILEDCEKEGVDPATVLTQSTFHGRSMGVCAQIETNGIPMFLQPTFGKAEARAQRVPPGTLPGSHGDRARCALRAHSARAARVLHARSARFASRRVASLRASLRCARTSSNNGTRASPHNPLGQFQPKHGHWQQSLRGNLLIWL